MKKTYIRTEIDISILIADDIIATCGATISNGGELTDSVFDVTCDELFGEKQLHRRSQKLRKY